MSPTRLTITVLSLLLWGCGPTLTPAPVPAPTTPFDSYLDNRASDTDFSGAILITQGETILLRTARGASNLEYEIPLTPEHVFRIGSVTKPLTAAVVLAQVEAGVLTLDDSLCDCIPGCPEPWRPVTIAHLLSHTSGIPDFFGFLPDAPVEETGAEVDRLLAERIDDLLAEKGFSHLLSVPGEEFAYSNFNYVLLGYALEVATGNLWEELLHQTLFDPLAMTNSAYDDVWAIVPGRATGYRIREGHVINSQYDDHSAYAAGGLRSTVDDLDRFLVGLTRGRVIGADLLDQSMSPNLENYGYGWQILELFGHRMFNHSGGISGFSSHIAYYPEEDLRLIVLSNRAQEDAKATACDLAALFFEAEPIPTGTAAWLETPRGERCRESSS